MTQKSRVTGPGFRARSRWPRTLTGHGSKVVGKGRSSGSTTAELLIRRGYRGPLPWGAPRHAFEKTPHRLPNGDERGRGGSGQKVLGRPAPRIGTRKEFEKAFVRRGRQRPRRKDGSARARRPESTEKKTKRHIRRGRKGRGFRRTGNGRVDRLLFEREGRTARAPQLAGHELSVRSVKTDGPRGRSALLRKGPAFW